MKYVIVGTAGHIDHGKSTLVEALTGTHPDRLEEEKRRGITIDLGFAFLDLDGVRVGFVDVPGHERFVRNMLAGVGGIDLVLLVVAADESVKPQTREHFDICRLIGIQRGIVVVTKADLVDADVLELVRLEIEDYVRGSFLEGAPVVPVSARTGAGIDRLRQEMLRAASGSAPRDASRHFRLPVDRAFVMKGFGTVVTGTLISGSLHADQEVELFPARRRARVRRLHSAGKEVNEASAGQRTAVNLAGVELEEIRRGMVLASPGCFEPTQRLDARVTLLPASRPLKTRARAHFHQGTCETVAEIVLMENATLAPGGSGQAQLRLAHPVLVLPGDRFILRQFSPLVTIGGGTVIDALAPRFRPRSRADTVAFLAAIEHGTPEEILAAFLLAEKSQLTLRQIIARTGWTERDARKTIEALEASGKVRILEKEPLRVAAANLVLECARAAREEIERFHSANPLVPGISKEELRGRIGASREIFQAALDRLIGSNIVRVSQDVVMLAGRQISLLPEEAQAKHQIEREFERTGLAVPRWEEVLTKLSLEPARARKLLQILLREKVLIKVTEDLVFHGTAMAHLRAILTQYRKEKGERLSVPVFKELTGITRKYAIPLLEYLDRERVTRRVGDERVIL
jgi:selenocysteine-specific elongation factor